MIHPATQTPRVSLTLRVIHTRAWQPRARAAECQTFAANENCPRIALI